VSCYAKPAKKPTDKTPLDERRMFFSPAFATLAADNVPITPVGRQAMLESSQLECVIDVVFLKEQKAG
jgi:hypothetical protein